MRVEPLQPYSDPERLVNDMSQIVSWCGNLIVLDGTVQFTHQTVKMFLLDGFWDQNNADLIACYAPRNALELTTSNVKGHYH